MTADSTTGVPLPADLPADLVDANADTVDWTHLVHGVLLTGTLDAPDLADVEIDGCRLERVRAIGGHIAQFALTDSVLAGCDLSGVDLPEARWERVTAAESRLAGCSFAGGFWLDVELVDGAAPRLDLRFATLRRVRFADVDLTGIDLTGATLDNVSFTGCAMAGAYVDQLNVKRAHFTDCDLTGAHGVEALRGASMDASTMQSLAGSMAAALGVRVDSQIRRAASSTG